MSTVAGGSPEGAKQGVPSQQTDTKLAPKIRLQPNTSGRCCPQPPRHPRKETYPEHLLANLSAYCYTCESRAVGAEVLLHLYFGELGCQHCFHTLKTCAAFQSHYPMIGLCKGSAGCHNACRWASPCKYIMYNTRLTLAMTHGPKLDKTEVFREATKYLRALLPLRALYPWRSALKTIVKADIAVNLSRPPPRLKPLDQRGKVMLGVSGLVNVEKSILRLEKKNKKNANLDTHHGITEERDDSISNSVHSDSVTNPSGSITTPPSSDTNPSSSITTPPSSNTNPSSSVINHSDTSTTFPDRAATSTSRDTNLSESAPPVGSVASYTNTNANPTDSHITVGTPADTLEERGKKIKVDKIMNKKRRKEKRREKIEERIEVKQEIKEKEEVYTRIENFEQKKENKNIKKKRLDKEEMDKRKNNEESDGKEIKKNIKKEQLDEKEEENERKTKKIERKNRKEEDFTRIENFEQKKEENKKIKKKRLDKEEMDKREKNEELDEEMKKNIKKEQLDDEEEKNERKTKKIERKYKKEPKITRSQDSKYDLTHPPTKDLFSEVLHSLLDVKDTQSILPEILNTYVSSRNTTCGENRENAEKLDSFSEVLHDSVEDGIKKAEKRRIGDRLWGDISDGSQTIDAGNRSTGNGNLSIGDRTSQTRRSRTINDTNGSTEDRKDCMSGIGIRDRNRSIDDRNSDVHDRKESISSKNTSISDRMDTERPTESYKRRKGFDFDEARIDSFEVVIAYKQRKKEVEERRKEKEKKREEGIIDDGKYRGIKDKEGKRKQRKS